MKLTRTSRHSAKKEIEFQSPLGIKYIYEVSGGRLYCKTYDTYAEHIGGGEFRGERETIMVRWNYTGAAPTVSISVKMEREMEIGSLEMGN